MSDEGFGKLREQHYESEDGLCDWDSAIWPCDTARLLAEWDEAWTAVSRFESEASALRAERDEALARGNPSVGGGMNEAEYVTRLRAEHGKADGAMVICMAKHHQGGAPCDTMRLLAERDRLSEELASQSRLAVKYLVVLDEVRCEVDDLTGHRTCRYCKAQLSFWHHEADCPIALIFGEARLSVRDA